MNGLSDFLWNITFRFIRRYPAVFDFILSIRPIKRWLNRFLIERYVGFGKPRPRPYSLKYPFSAWPSLTDRTVTGRQLGKDFIDRKRPSPEELLPLFERKGPMHESTETSVLFANFAQWFTDSFIRTRREDQKDVWTLNTSNHEIDLCQIYGLSSDATTLLRCAGGRLNSEIDAEGEEYPPRLFAKGSTRKVPIFTDPKLRHLHSEGDLDFLTARVDEADLPSLFATALVQGNATSGNIVLTTVFLRAHNRVADKLRASYVDWSDDQVFETARNVMIVLLLKIVLHDYIAHIAPLPFPFEIDPEVGERKGWKRSNWISIEFGMLYRWHALVPDEFDIGAQKVAIDRTVFNPDFVTDTGLAPLISATSLQKAGRIELGNTPKFFTELRTMWLDGLEVQSSVQQKTIEMGRRAQLKPYNAYRRAFGMNPIRSFDELTDHPQTAQALSDMYDSVEDLDWYVGLLAERHDAGEMFGTLMTRMVGFDAFTHIFGNPLLAKGVYNPTTFSDVGWEIIQSTGSFGELVDWVVRPPCHVSFQA